MFESTIDADTLKAYLETEYRVHGSDPFILRVGELCPALAAVHTRHRVDCSAFVTPCNPFGRMLDDTCNDQRYRTLGCELRQSGLAIIEGIGKHPTGHWPGEASYLILGLAQPEAKALGARLEQNALIWTGADAVPQLILIR